MKGVPFLQINEEPIIVLKNIKKPIFRRTQINTRIKMNEIELLSHFKSLIGKTLHTLHDERPFTVDALKAKSIDITTSKDNPRSVTLKGIISAFKELTLKSEITRTKIDDHYTDGNASYIASILASLPTVKYDLGPIRLYITT